MQAICTESAPAARRATAEKAGACARFFGRGAAGRGCAFGADCGNFGSDISLKNTGQASPQCCVLSMPKPQNHRDQKAGTRPGGSH